MSRGNRAPTVSEVEGNKLGGRMRKELDAGD